ncbi:MAG TPA: hypothetical protein VK622_15605, partial [Puia sp.]|nr:hypothetical protein [Puia sp.]
PGTIVEISSFISQSRHQDQAKKEHQADFHSVRFTDFQMANHVKGNYFSKMMDGVRVFYIGCSRNEVVARSISGWNPGM